MMERGIEALVAFGKAHPRLRGLMLALLYAAYLPGMMAEWAGRAYGRLWRTWRTVRVLVRALHMTGAETIAAVRVRLDRSKCEMKGGEAPQPVAVTSSFMKEDVTKEALTMRLVRFGQRHSALRGPMLALLAAAYAPGMLAETLRAVPETLRTALQAVRESVSALYHRAKESLTARNARLRAACTQLGSVSAHGAQTMGTVSRAKVPAQRRGPPMPRRVLSMAMALTLMVGMVPAVTGTASAGNTATNSLPGAGGTLYDGYVYTATNATITNTSAGSSGLNVASGATVVLYIPSGVTLTVKGGDGNYSTPGGAGIYVPYGSTLIITGGTLNATGGRGGSGSRGVDANYYRYSSGSPGGNGGGGPGAGIGGSGGYGGEGGLGGDWKVNRYYGDSGASGDSGIGMGTLYILGNVSVNATAGTQNTSAGAGGANQGNYGGGAGGGGFGGAAANIGGGGGGGGGGGAGGGGGDANADLISSAYMFGKDGTAYSGGAGGKRHSRATKNQDGGRGGNQGSQGGSGTTYRGNNYRPSAATYTVYFNKAGGSGGTSSDSVTLGTNNHGRISIPSSPGYTFTGYYYGGTKYYDASGDPTSSCSPWTYIGDRTLNATWSANTYTINLNPNGGTVGTSSVNVTYDAALPTVTGLPTKKGYNFDGFFTDPNGGTRYYNANGTAVPGVRYQTAGNTTLYAHWTLKTTSVTLNANGGTPASTVTATFGYAMPSVTPPTKNGYTFDGYWTDSTGAGTRYYAQNGTSVKAWDQEGSTATLYAKWVPNSYTLTFDAQGGSGGGSVAVTYKATMPGTTIPDKPGYSFGGYYTSTNGGGTQYYTSTGTTAKIYEEVGPLTLYARWTANKYTIQLYSEGKYINYPMNNVTYGSVTLPTQEQLSARGIDISRRHYIFQGWNIYEEQNWAMYTAGKNYNIGLTTVPNGTVQIYAAWKMMDSSVVTYNLNGGINPPPNDDVFAGDPYTIPLTKPTRDNYTFLGWSKDPAATKVDYAPGGTFTITGSVTLYAVWKLNYSVSYSANGGTCDLTPEKTYPATGTTVTVQFANTPNRTGYTFQGWAETSNAVVAMYVENGVKTFSMPAKEITLYAVCSPIPLNVTYADDALGRYTYSTRPGQTHYGSSYSFTVTLPKYINCDKLWVAVNDSRQITPEVIITPSDGSRSYTYTISGPTVDQSVTVGGYDYQSYTVALDTGGGKVEMGNVTSYRYSVGAVLPTAVTRAGYTFDGWYTAKTGGTKATDIKADESGAKTYYAHWTVMSYVVTFSANGGAGSMADQTIQYDKATKLNGRDASILFGSNTFLGWSTQPDAVKPEYLDKSEVLNLSQGSTVTLYAVWNLPSYTVAYSANGGTWESAPPVAEVFKENSDAAVQFTNCPTRKGYAFTGWNEAQAGNGMDYKMADQSVKITQIQTDTVLYATWEARPYSVRFDANGGSGSIEPQVMLYNNTSSLSSASGLMAPTDKPFFLGWSELSSATSPSYLEGQSVTNLMGELNLDGTLPDVTLYAIWGPAQLYYVSYDGNGGTWSGGNVPPASTGSAITLDTGDDTYARGDAVSEPTSNTPLYADWKPNAYTVHFDVGPESGAPVDQTLTYDTPQALSLYAGIRDNYKFMGWATTQGSDVVAYQHGQSVLNLTQAPGGTVDLYAGHMGYDMSARADLSGYAANAMSWAVGSGLISGRNGGLLAPQGETNRAEAAAILMRFVRSVKPQ